MARLDTPASAERFTIQHLAQLKGKRVAHIVRDANSHDPCFGLEFDDGTVAWCMADPEGNGPGWLGIVKTGKVENN